MNVKPALCALCLAGPVSAQGFAGLGADAEGFALPAPAPEFSFPADHGAHPDFRIEWWYVTAALNDAAGAPYGLQWTLFRTALEPGSGPGWEDPQIWFAHAAISSETAHYYAERWARGGIGQAGVTAAPFEAWLDEWALAGETFDQLSLTAAGPDFSYDMALTAEGPLVRHGDNGFSVKSASGQASYYYSQPHFRIEGTLTFPDGPVEVTGNAWLDREWSSQPLEPDQTGWDWFSLHLDDGAKLMGYRLRNEDGSSYDVATYVAPEGEVRRYEDGTFSARVLREAQVAGRAVPVDWEVTLPPEGISVEVRAVNDQSWMATTVPYWEGPVRVSGSHGGRGYLEMTGYE